jgi:hypothetical protein
MRTTTATLAALLLTAAAQAQTIRCEAVDGASGRQRADAPVAVYALDPARGVATTPGGKVWQLVAGPTTYTMTQRISDRDLRIAVVVVERDSGRGTFGVVDPATERAVGGGIPLLCRLGVKL